MLYKRGAQGTGLSPAPASPTTVWLEDFLPLSSIPEDPASESHTGRVSLYALPHDTGSPGPWELGLPNPMEE